MKADYEKLTAVVKASGVTPQYGICGFMAGLYGHTTSATTMPRHLDARYPA